MWKTRKLHPCQMPKKVDCFSLAYQPPLGMPKRISKINDMYSSVKYSQIGQSRIEASP